MYLSRLAAHKEYAFMKVLWREGFRIPEPLGWNRHTVVMEFVDAFPLRMVERVPEPGRLYVELIDIIVALAQRGLIHGDFNEFNILLKESEDATTGNIELEPVVIDFPQTVSTNHADAEMYFDRDVGCVKRYFERRFKYLSDEAGPFFRDAVKGIDPERRLDVEVEASGFSKKMARDLEGMVGIEGLSEEVEHESKSESEGEERDGDEGDVEEHENEGDVDEEREDKDAVSKDPQVDDPKLVEEIGGLSIHDDLAVKPMNPRDFGLMPLEMAHDPDAVAEKIHSKKKAAGWAI